MLLVLTLAPPAVAGQASPSATPALTPAEMETFLLKARIVRKRDAGQGVTGSRRVTLSDGSLTHDAHVQTVDIAEDRRSRPERPRELNFKDTYRFNIAAYRLATLLGIRVPMSVSSAPMRASRASFTWWVDDVAMDEAGRLKADRRAARSGAHLEADVRDARVRRADPERGSQPGNMLWTKDWTLWLIDHTRAFRLDKRAAEAGRPGARSNGRCWPGCATLDRHACPGGCWRFADQDELEAVLARRNALVRHFDERIALAGEAAVLFDLAVKARVPRQRWRRRQPVAGPADPLAAIEVDSGHLRAPHLERHGRALWEELAGQHAAVDLHDPPAEARDNPSREARRVADHERLAP